MKRITWNEAKAVELRRKNGSRGVSFEECYEAIIEGKVLDIIANPSEKYSSQKLFILDNMGYLTVFHTLKMMMKFF